MSADTADSRAIARATRSLLKGAGAQLAGKARGRDHGEGRRVPRRHSYEVNDPRATPWTKVGDGSYVQGTMHCEALLKTAEELYHVDWKALPLRAVREARERHAACSAELNELLSRDDAPTGRPAAIRQELGRLGALLERADLSLRRVDLSVLKALLKRIDFRTGRLDPAIETIADDAGCHRNSVVGALRRLKAHGLIDWVRRTVRTGNEGEFAPQLEQTSNAYHFDHRRKMASRTWQRFLQILTSKLRRLGRMAKGVEVPTEAPSRPKSPELAAALARMELTLQNAST